jgi:hypothetical protein
MNKPTIVPQNPKFISKMSNANKLRNAINRIDKILGVQNKNLFLIFGFFFASFFILSAK